MVKIAVSSCQHSLTRFASSQQKYINDLPTITFVKTFINDNFFVVVKCFLKFIVKLLHSVYFPPFEFKEICLGSTKLY